LDRKTRNNSQKRIDAQTVFKKSHSRKTITTRKASQVAKISHSMAKLIFKYDKGLKPYEMPDLYEIEAANYSKRLDFCCWANCLPNNAIECLHSEIIITIIGLLKA